MMAEGRRSALTIEVQRTDEGVHVTVGGELDLATADELTAAVGSPVASDRSITIDCGGLTFLDSVGIRAFVELHNEAATAGVDFRLVRVPPMVRRVLEITQLLDVLHVLDAEPPPGEG